MLGAHLDSWHTRHGRDRQRRRRRRSSMEAFRILKTLGLSDAPHAPPRALERRRAGTARRARLRARAPRGRGQQGCAREDVGVLQHRSGQGPDLRLVSREQRRADADLRRVARAVQGPAARRAEERASGRSAARITSPSSRAGVPGFNPIQDYVDYDVREHHTNADTAERIKESDLKQNAIILAAFVYHAAMRAEMLPSPVRK